MLIQRFVVRIFSVAIIVLGIGVVQAQDYPIKPIRIFTAQPGSSADLLARFIAQGVSGPLGQSVIVDNRSGAIPIELVSKSPPDGHTLILYGGDLWLSPLLKNNVSWDPFKDFSPITLATKTPTILVVHPSLPVKSVKELIFLGKSKPGELNFGTSGTGGASHLTGELFKSMAGLNMVPINYSGTQAAVTDVVGGRLHLTFIALGSVAAHIKAGRLRALAITSADPSALAPGVPTVAATLPGFESASIIGMHAPARTSATITSRLNHEIVRFLRTPEVKEKLVNAGLESVGSSAEEFAIVMKSETARWAKVIKDAGIQAE